MCGILETKFFKYKCTKREVPPLRQASRARVVSPHRRLSRLLTLLPPLWLAAYINFVLISSLQAAVHHHCISCAVFSSCTILLPGTFRCVYETALVQASRLYCMEHCRFQKGSFGSRQLSYSINSYMPAAVLIV